MNSGSISLPLFDQPDPAFYRGSTARTRATSASGAIRALEDRATKVATVRRLWAQPHTIQEIASISGFPISSICSLKKCLDGELVEVDAVEKLWADGRITKRTRWQLAKRAQE